MVPYLIPEFPFLNSLIPGLQSGLQSGCMASKNPQQLQQERNTAGTRPKLSASKKASTRGRGLSCGHGVSSRGTLSSREVEEGLKGMHGCPSGVGGSHKPAKVEKEGGTKTLQTSHLKSSSCGDLHPGTQRKRPHKGSSFGSTSYLTTSSVADRQKCDSSANSTAPTGQGEGRRKMEEKGSSHGVPPNSKQRATESVDGSGLSKSATVSRLEREVAELRQENATLKKQLAEVRSVSEQLLHEAPSENFAERRVQLLKSQIIQLERQVLLLSQVVSSNTEVLLELQNMLDSFSHKISTLVKAADGTVTVPPDDIDDIISTARTMKGRLTKRSQCSSLESLARPLLFMDAFLKPSRTTEAETPVTLIDVCSGRTEHINLRHVSRLESRLAELYGVLVGLEASLQTVPTTNRSLPSLFQPIREHLGGHVTKSCKLIGECCHSLLCLSLLVPAAPWPPFKSSEVSLDLRADTILERLPPFVRSKKEGREVIEAAAKAFNYHNQMQMTKCQALEHELQFHKSVYELQLNYVETLFGAMGKGYQTFEQSVQELICQPLQAILQHYQELRQTASDEALRKFLQAFQENHQQLQHANESLKTLEPSSGPQTHPQPQGLVALSLFGQHFFESLSELEAECSRKREEQLQ